MIDKKKFLDVGKMAEDLVDLKAKISNVDDRSQKTRVVVDENTVKIRNLSGTLDRYISKADKDHDRLKDSVYYLQVWIVVLVVLFLVFGTITFNQSKEIRKLQNQIELIVGTEEKSKE